MYKYSILVEGSIENETWVDAYTCDSILDVAKYIENNLTLGEKLLVRRNFE